MRSMKILIVSGFLGAGKTTFIKELIKRTGTKPVVLENEYGDNSIDAKELRREDFGTTSESSADNSAPSGDKKLEVLEFMEGCVCCTMKDSFINSVLTVFTGLSPEYLIVEPTGVGRLSNIIENLQPLMHGNISLLKPVVVLSPRSYRQNMNEWPDLYRDQVAHAQIVVFSKCESEDPEVLMQTEGAIRSINPDAEIVHEHYSLQGDEWWRSIMDLPANDPGFVVNEDGTLSLSKTDNLSSSENDGNASSDGANDFSQITLNHAHLENATELVIMLEDCLRGQFGHIARAKGTIPVGSETLRFDLAEGLYSITDSPEESNQCVFIGKELDKEKICRRLGSSLQIESLTFKKPSFRRRELRM